MRRTIKCGLLFVLRAVGLFALARRRTRGALRILCYHGGSLRDEHLFMPSNFMHRETFRRRLAYLSQARYPVLGLGEAVERLAAGTLPAGATVLTIDDGFFSTYHDFVPALREFGFPATVYVTTYHVAKGTPVFRLVVQYLFWKSLRVELDCTGLEAGIEGVQSLRTAAEKKRICWQIIRWGESRSSDPQRCALARELGRLLGVDYEDIAESRLFGLATADEIREIAGAGIDIQLHTHRHHLPDERGGVEREVAENREFLSGLSGRPLEHFCYPSGHWTEEQARWLPAVGVLSATTCDAGLNYAPGARHVLRRMLDCDNATSIEFAAEMSGLCESLRSMRSRLKRLLSPGAAER